MAEVIFHGFDILLLPCDDMSELTRLCGSGRTSRQDRKMNVGYGGDSHTGRATVVSTPAPTPNPKPPMHTDSPSSCYADRWSAERFFTIYAVSRSASTPPISKSSLNPSTPRNTTFPTCGRKQTVGRSIVVVDTRGLPRTPAVRRRGPNAIAERATPSDRKRGEMRTPNGGKRFGDAPKLDSGGWGVWRWPRQAWKWLMYCTPGYRT